MQHTRQGYILFSILLFAASATLVLTGFVGWAGVNLRALRGSADRELAFHIAEAGIDYYRWHLAHAPTDYQDGTGQPGPYVHEFENAAGEHIGTFTLTITPPPTGSTVVTIRSTGEVDTAPGVRRTIEVRLAIPSLAEFAVVSAASLRFGEGTEVFGPIHSNGGVHFDGLAHNIVTSAKDEYKDPDHSGNDEFGVHTHVSPVDPMPPAAVPNRTDVFEAGRLFPVPAVDFAGLTSDLASIKEDAQSGGYYFPASGGLGYHVVLKTNDSFDLYRVNTLVPVPNGCTNVVGQQGWGSWSIAGTGQSLLGTYTFPDNELVFFEDHVWVDGKIDGARITIAAGRFPDNPAQRRSITINKDLLYTNYDGSDLVGLIAQDNINVGMVSEDDLRIDAALVAQNGRIGRNYYRAPSGGSQRCSPYHIRDTITLYGSLATYDRYGFAYTDGTGYQNRNIIYDGNLLYAPPPSFPLTSDQYTTISWEEIEE